MRRFVGLLAMPLLLLAGAGPATAASPLDDLTFVIGRDGLFAAPSTGAAGGAGGTWSLEGGQLRSERIDLQLEIKPAQPPLAVGSGPAVLFAGLSLYGDAGGDVAAEARVPPVAYSATASCKDADCTYAFSISISTKQLATAIERLPGKLIWVSADLTLIRTYGGGTWLQVLPLGNAPGASASTDAGRLGAIRPASGSLQSAGLFPMDQAKPIPDEQTDFKGGLDYPGIVDALRRKVGDRSVPIPTVPVALHLEFTPKCPYELELFLHDDAGNHAFFTNDLVQRSAIDAATILPPGRSWFITLDAGDGVGNPMIRLGPIIPATSPVEIGATLDCAAKSGSLHLTGAATPQPTQGGHVATPMPIATSAAPPTVTPTSAPTAAVDPHPAAKTPSLVWLVAAGIVIGVVATILFLVGRGRYRRS